MAPVEPSLSRVPAASNQVPPWHPKGPGENQNQNARADAQVREATAPPGDRLGSPAAAPSSPEAPPAKPLNRAERAARNRAAWAARSRSTASAARVPPPRRASAYQAREHQAPDPAPALAALREWRESHLPALGRDPDPPSATPAPVLDPPRRELGRWHPIALGGLLGAMARGQGYPHAGQHEGSHRLGNGPDSPTRSEHRRPEAPSGPHVESRSPSLWSPHPRR